MPACWIFDIDGTIADLGHRLHHIHNKPKDWKAFNEAMMDDKIITPTVMMIDALAIQNVNIVLCSGRSDDNRERTVKWLRDNEVFYDALYMRKYGDYRPDHIVKSELLDQVLADGWTPHAVVDDRLSVCRMWHSRGLFVFCANQGFVEF